MIKLSAKQKEYINNATHRYNVKSGAVRSGKTFCDIATMIPVRICERHGKPGLNVILGVSRDTIERNVLAPMRELYGESLVRFINTSKNTAMLFGEEVYCLGAEKISQVAKIQGSSIKYCYGDEIVKWNREVFEMLKSRMDKPYSCFDGACNPDTPTHWFKQFIDSDVDMYLQRYTIFDNPFLDEDFVKNLCKEYDGTIFYDRYILGEWKRAEGSIYKKFANNPQAFRSKITPKEIDEISIGVDFGGNQSGHSFVARGYENGYDNVWGLMTRRVMQRDYPEDIDANVLNDLVIKFINDVQDKYGKVGYLFWDNAETVLGKGLKNAIGEIFPDIIVRPAKKIRIKDRIDCMLRLLGAERFYYTEDCQELETALCDAVWNEKAGGDERLDDGTSDIDTLDAWEYTYERDIKSILRGE